LRDWDLALGMVRVRTPSVGLIRWVGGVADAADGGPGRRVAGREGLLQGFVDEVA
jgi:hypothetical protein